MPLQVVDLNPRAPDDEGIFLRVDIRILALKPGPSKDNSVVEEPGHHVEEDTGLLVAGDVKGAVGHFRDPNLCRLIEGDHTTFRYREAREMELGSYTFVN